MYGYKCTNSEGIQKVYTTIAGAKRDNMTWHEIENLATGNVVN